MLTLKTDMKQYWYAKELVQNGNFGRRGEFDGNYDQQLLGMLAQTIVADYFGIPRPVDNGKADGGVDYRLAGHTIDIKTMGRTVDMQDHFVHNLYGAQAKFNTDILLFASYNKRKDELTVCGWLPKQDFLTKATFYESGTVRHRDNGTSFTVRGKHGNYEIPQTELNAFNNGTEFLLRLYDNWLKNRKGVSSNAK